ncbi:MAG TPA: hypothetical protein VFT99_22585, partial [Roseiflexaceae bacterium]|nr:hypothetical protein [Roseiflexaceae bacterium]
EMPAPSNPHITQRLTQHDADELLGARSPLTSPLSDDDQESATLPAGDAEQVSEAQLDVFEIVDGAGAEEPDSEALATQQESSDERQVAVDDDHLPAAHEYYELLPIAVPADSVVKYSPYIERWIDLLRSDGDTTFRYWAERICQRPGDLPKLLRGLIREPAILEHADEAPYQHALTDELQAILASLSSEQELFPPGRAGYQAGDEANRNGNHS